MTSASELFYNRRSRVGRDTVELGFDSALDRNLNNRRHHNHYTNNTSRRDRLDLDACDPVRRSPNHRHLPHRSFNPEHESVRFDQFSRQSTLENIINSENVSSARNGFSGNDRLPGAVVLARERLLQRLRGASLSRNRLNNRIISSSSSDIDGNDLTSAGNDIGLFLLDDGGNWETEMSSRVRPISYSDSNSQTMYMPMREEVRKRAPGLSQETMDGLRVEVFCDMKCKGTTTEECSICLESFIGGDELICLPCGHSFHSCCLVPWVRTCGDCPYCRRVVVVL